MIEAVNLSKQFERTVKHGRKSRREEFQAVDRVSLKAEPGEIVGILGPNGAGKTTLLRMLGMLMTPTSGEVRLTDKEGNLIDEVTRKKELIGYLSGNTKLYPRFSIREYLLFLGDIYGYSKDDALVRAEEIIRVLAMEKFADNRIQRASIARCLMADPQLYILDEPTLGLDILSADAIIRFMEEQKEKGKTVLYSTHYLEEAQILCNRIYMIFQGRIVAEGTPFDIMKKTGTESLRQAFHSIFEGFSYQEEGQGAQS